MIVLVCVMILTAVSDNLMKAYASTSVETAEGTDISSTVSENVALPTATPIPTATPSPTPEPVTLDNLYDDFQQLDDKFLVLVNEHVAIPQDYDLSLDSYNGEQLSADIMDCFKQMVSDASNDGVNLKLSSGYRDEATQRKLLENGIKSRMNDYGMSEKEATENALKSFALPGHSEHHTGLAADFNSVSSDFKETKEYKWLTENAWKYGFVERYPEEKTAITGIIYEPWHYRYVGKENAKAMNKLGMCLEEYVVYLKNLKNG